MFRTEGGKGRGYKDWPENNELIQAARRCNISTVEDQSEDQEDRSGYGCPEDGR
jgi:hypothetical protein